MGGSIVCGGWVGRPWLGDGDCVRGLGGVCVCVYERGYRLVV